MKYCGSYLQYLNLHTMMTATIVPIIMRIMMTAMMTPVEFPYKTQTTVCLVKYGAL